LNESQNLGLKYDLVGNRLEEVIDGQPPLLYKVNTVNEYQAVGGNFPTYDSAGNMTGDGVLEHRYDALYRLVRVFTTQTTTQCHSQVPCSPGKLLKRMAGTTGLEPATSAVTDELVDVTN
jgi:hypothetical protein